MKGGGGFKLFAREIPVRFIPSERKNKYCEAGLAVNLENTKNNKDLVGVSRLNLGVPIRLEGPISRIAVGLENGTYFNNLHLPSVYKNTFYFS